MNICVDCGKQLKTNAAKRCYSCAAKERLSRPGAREQIAVSVGMASKRMWSNPKFRERMHIMYQDPEFRAKMVRPPHLIWTEAARAKFSYSMRRIWAAPNSPFRTQDYHDKKSIAAKQQWVDGLCDESFNSTSTYEDIVAQALDNIGINYERQYRPDGYYRLYDFNLIDHNVLMEVDGAFWHESEWVKQYGIPERDAEKEQWALDHGYGFVRLDEATALDDNLQSALEECFQKGGPKCC